MKEYEKIIQIRPQYDAFDEIRMEYAQMLKNQLAKGNNGLIKTNDEMIFVSHDHQFIQTIANRIIILTENGVIDKRMTYDEYLEQNRK